MADARRKTTAERTAENILKRDNSGLVFQTFEKAISENPDATPRFHSDRGFQYTSPMFQSRLDN